MRFPLTAFTALSAFFSINDDHVQSVTTPSDCLNPVTQPLLENVVECLERFTIPKNAFGTVCSGSGGPYERAQPDKDQLAAWKSTLGSLLDVNGDCSSFSLPGALRLIYTVSQYTEPGVGGKSFCIVYETWSVGSPPRYVLGWGHVVVPARRADVSRCIHLSAPHPGGPDKGTPKQAAAIFKRTGAKSLLITGRHRNASPCPSCQGSDYFKTDAAHDIREPFHEAMKAIRVWQDAHGGCPSMTCAYIQMHGEGSNRCPGLCTSDTFMSVGLGRGRPGETCSINYYRVNNPPAKRIREALNTVFPSWINHLPPDDSCCLTATDNIFGRLVNAVPGATDDSVCTTATRCGVRGEYVSGQFAHIEQETTPRDASNYNGWATAINMAFSKSSCSLILQNSSVDVGDSVEVPYN